MIVQHNLTAMNSSRMLGLTTSSQAKSTEKLSSGYKINRAADDAAGLAISEKMRKQIRGLTQASTNAQDGISAVQTAEGALTEVHDMLQRMNELAVKAANGTNSQSDRQAIQAEIDQLVTEIDRVAETTKFNETYLLRGDRNVVKQYSYNYGAVGASKTAGAVMIKDAATGLNAAIAFSAGAKAADQNAIAKALRDQGITVSAETTGDETKYTVSLNGKATEKYSVNAMSADKFEIVDLEGKRIATVTANMSPVNVDGTEEDDGEAPEKVATILNPVYAEDGTELDADGLKAALEAGDKIYTTAPTGLKAQSSNAGLTVDATVAGLKAGEYTYNGTDWEDADGNTAPAGLVTAGTAANGDTITVAIDPATGTEAVEDTDYTYKEAETEEPAPEQAKVAAKVGAQLYDAVGNALDMTAVAASVAANQNLTGSLNLRLHVGADATSDNQISLNIETMSAKGLGLNGLKISGTDDGNALSAIETIKDAIQKVSTQRSALGAVQNRLEHTINNLDNVVENTTSAEAQIRDTDMADEMVKYSNNNILAQAGQAMLAQANQSNQGVLSLLG